MQTPNTTSVETRDHSGQADAGSAGGRLPSALTNATFRAVAIDSRAVEPGDLFVALPGEHTDGHRFVVAALARGAHAAIVDATWAREAAAQLPADTQIVDDTTTVLRAPAIVPVASPLVALQALAAQHRARFDLPVIGITGSVGKTSTKQLIAAVLQQHVHTLSSVKSFNNEIGVPLTLLRLEPSHQAAVIEMGTFGPGEIAMLCQLARPHYGIVTNVGVSHLERMKTREVVAQAKGELVEALPADGLALLNGDDALARGMRARARARVLLYGLGPDNDVRATAVSGGGLDPIAFTVHIGGEERRIHTALIGEHNVYTALVAIAIARELDVPWEAIETGLNAAGAQARLTLRRGARGATLLDDTYNASPASCAAALAVLRKTPGRHVAVFGDMAELGPEEEQGHRAVGVDAARAVDLLVVVGAKARMIGQAAAEQRPDLDIAFAATNEEAIALLRERIQEGDFVLVKGARVAATEQIVAALAEEGSV